MKNSVLKSIIHNRFLVNYQPIMNYFEENDLTYNGESKIDGGFTLSFCPSDDKQTFEKNLKTQPEDWYYRTHPVKYTLNSSGYRTREFDDIDWKESIVMFGGSDVMGIGVTDEHTISYFLEQLSGRPVINMGIAAASAQTALHNSIILSDSEYPTPKAVVYYFTNLRRFHIYGENFIDFIEFNGFLNGKDSLIFSNLCNTVPFNLINIKMIRNLWKNKTIYYEGSCFGQEKLINKLDTKICCDLIESEDDWARDLSHSGTISTMNFAKQIYEKIKPQLGN